MVFRRRSRSVDAGKAGRKGGGGGGRRQRGRGARSVEGSRNTAPPSPIHGGASGGGLSTHSPLPQQIIYNPHAHSHTQNAQSVHYHSDDDDSYYGTGSTASYSINSKKSGGIRSRLFKRGGGGRDSTGDTRSVASMPPNGYNGHHQQQQSQDYGYGSGYGNSPNHNNNYGNYGNYNSSSQIMASSSPPSDLASSQSLASKSQIETPSQKKGWNDKTERFQVLPDDAYPDTFWTRDELRLEMNKKSVLYHDLRSPATKASEIGQLRIEVLQCFGLPTTSLLQNHVTAYAVAVCGSAAFRTDTMPPVANPMWLCRMRRACTFGVHRAYQRVFVGIFDAGVGSGGPKADDFCGRVAIDLARLRPGCTYDVTLPLRLSAHVYTTQPQGAVRLRLHLNYTCERSAVLSYVPTSLNDVQRLKSNVPNTNEAVSCLDEQSFRNVALTVHGAHMPGKFSLTLLKSTVREIDFTRIHVLRYMRKQQWYNLRYYVYPSISAFVFMAWMHAIWFNTVRYIPGHIVVVLLLHLYKNYAYYAMDSPLQNGFLAPTLEELYAALIQGGKKGGKKSSSHKPCIQPLTMEMDGAHATHRDSLQKTDTVEAMRAPGGLLALMEKAENATTVLPGGRSFIQPTKLSELADEMRKLIPVQTYRYRFKTYKNCFSGKQAVTFLVMNGYAYSREEAVVIGRRLAKETLLFEHVARRHDFQDENYYYHFLEYDTRRYKIKACHEPKGKKVLDFLGFYYQRQNGGGTDIIEAREHIEFPFAQGTDHPRFTVKESLVIRNAEAKKLWKEQQEANDVVECVEFGVAPAVTQHDDGNDDTEHDSQYGGSATGGRKSSIDMMAGSVHSERKSSMDTGAVGKLTETVTRTARRASLVATTAAASATTAVTSTATAAAQFGTSAVTTVTSSAMAVTETLGQATGFTTAKEKPNMAAAMVFGDPEELYEKLRSKKNPTLDNVLELQRQANEYDPYAYDSDNDVDMVHKRRGKRKGVIVEEKTLKKPPNQDFSKKIGKGDKAFSKVCQEARHKVHGILFHAFDDHVYKVDKNLFPTTPQDGDGLRDLKETEKKKKRNFLARRGSNDADKEELERKKRAQMTPYDNRKDEYDRILYINKYSHANPWMNRVAVVIQPLVEIAQAWLFLLRALFNVFTWQDPILSFWLAIGGPVLVVVLYLLPYRVLFTILGWYLVGPQNYAMRLYQESRPGYQPPDFDKIVKTKRPKKEEKYEDSLFFSSEAPGNQQIKFKNVDPTQVKQLVVPSNMLKYNRFYDWPPEPEYCRVYASPPPRNQHASRAIDNLGGGDDSESDYDTSTGEAYMYDASKPKAKKKKKKKKGLKKIAYQVKKGTGATFNATMGVTESLYSTTNTMMTMTTDATVGVAKGATKVTKKAVKGTAKKAAKGTSGLFGLRRRKKGDYDDDEYY